VLYKTTADAVKYRIFCCSQPVFSYYTILDHCAMVFLHTYQVDLYGLFHQFRSGKTGFSCKFQIFIKNYHIGQTYLFKDGTIIAK
jgi:hypothetical protein